MVTRLFSRTPAHEHPEASQRILGLEHLSPESAELAALVTGDPAPEVRAAAAARCADPGALAAALGKETDAAVRTALAAALGRVLAAMADGAAARAFLEAPACTDAIRADVARQAHDADRRLAAIAGIRDEPLLVELALAGGHAETRLAAAECVRTPEGLSALVGAARNKDRGVTRLAKQRLEAMKDREGQASEADAILAQLEALAGTPGPILTAVVDLNRRWQVLDMHEDAARLERCDAARRALQARFDREQAEQAARAKFERHLGEWIAALAAPDGPEALAGLRTQLEQLREEAQALGDPAAPARLADAQARLDGWAQELQALAGAEALVVEAERLAADTSVDNAQLPERWQALDRAIRTPALTRRFEAALVIVEQRRLAQAQVAREEANATRNRIHALLHAAEQALAAGQLHATRAAVDEMKALKADAGALPKPTQQRMGRVGQQLGELERWESFGQQTARIQLCERAEAIATQALDAARTAAEVKKLREEWKTLDAQHAGVPRALWERFDGACEKAYAPAARHFAELAAQRKAARKQRDEFIAAAAAHVPTLLGETPDLRAIERWLRETDRAWREGELGSVDPGAWKKLDARLKEALAPLRAALSSAREQAKTGRLALIAEVEALAPRAMEREAPSLVKAVQARWQEHSKANPLAQRDERALWERFRAACDAVFEARHAKRKEEDGRKSEGRRALEDTCAQLEQLARQTEKDEKEVRGALRDLQDRWRAGARDADPALRALEGRFRSAVKSVEGSLSARVRSREAAVWKTLAGKERLCEELDAAVLSGGDAALPDSVRDRWAALPELPPAWEKKMLARREAALAALSDGAALGEYRPRIERGTLARRESLLELEMALGLDSPAEFQALRLALQVKLLKERFGGGATAAGGTTGDRLLAWCAQPGVIEGRDRERGDRVFSAMGQAG
ncbi:MAG TPA: DUF349 domain-containing protein [Usitatibacteraceae bacterium]|nr:DUF349 domain-containing protein [Usitatibacteraceae bacterium]